MVRGIEEAKEMVEESVMIYNGRKAYTALK
jgi:hypothetical protein